jgi:hypothetical protein
VSLDFLDFRSHPLGHAPTMFLSHKVHRNTSSQDQSPARPHGPVEIHVAEKNFFWFAVLEQERNTIERPTVVTNENQSSKQAGENHKK